MNELLSLIGGPLMGSHPVISSDELSQVLEEEWESRWGLKGAKYNPEGFTDQLRNGCLFQKAD